MSAPYLYVGEDKIPIAPKAKFNGEDLVCPECGVIIDIYDNEEQHIVYNYGKDRDDTCCDVWIMSILECRNGHKSREMLNGASDV